MVEAITDVPIVQPIEEPVENLEVQEPKPNLLQRVSSYKETPKQEEVAPTDDVDFDVNEINNIENPAAREYAMKAYKSMQRGFGKKLQERSELAKKVELLESAVNDTKSWTPEKIQSLLNDQGFVQAAQSVYQHQSQDTDEYSALSEAEQREITQLKTKIASLEQNNWQSVKVQQDEKLKSTYVNYNPVAIDTLTADLLQNKVQATREDLWKVIDYEPGIKRAYELGRQDEREGITEKANSLSVEGVSTSRNDSPLERKEGESSGELFKRVALKNLARIAGQQTR